MLYRGERLLAECDAAELLFCVVHGLLGGACGAGNRPVCPGPIRRNLRSAELSHRLKVSDRRRNTLKMAQNRSDS